MEENSRKYQFGTIEDILRGCEAEPTEPDRQTEMDAAGQQYAAVLFRLPRHEINVHEGFFCHMAYGQLEPLYFLTVIYDRADKEFLYDAEENFVDTVHQWLKGKCTLEQLEQEPCEVKGIKEDIVYGKSIQTGGSGRNPCRDGTACGSPGRHHGTR